jgi:hypothetical protein
MVIVAVGTGVWVRVAVAVGGTVFVAVGLGVAVGKNALSKPAHACSKTDVNTKTIRYLRIHNLFHAIIL